MSPTARSLALLRKQGCLAEVVERFIKGANIRRDLFGWCDIVSLYPYTNTYIVQFIQVTTKSNMKSRITKITESDTIGPVRKAGIEVAVHGWYKKGNRWHCEVVDLS